MIKVQHKFSDLKVSDERLLLVGESRQFKQPPSVKGDIVSAKVG